MNDTRKRCRNVRRPMRLLCQLLCSWLVWNALLFFPIPSRVSAWTTRPVSQYRISYTRTDPRSIRLFATETESVPVATPFATCMTTSETTSHTIVFLGSTDDDGTVQDPDVESRDDLMDGDDNGERVEEDGCDDSQTKQCVAAASAAVLSRKLANGGPRNTRSSQRNTSVGARRVASATRARSRQSRTSKLLKTVQTVAAASVKSSSGVESEMMNTTGTKRRSTSASNPSTSVIQSTIADLIQKRHMSMNETKSGGDDSMSMDILLEPFGNLVEDITADPLSHELLRTPMPGTVLVAPTTNTTKGWSPIKPECLTIRVAFPSDDLDIASLRLSVFSDFSNELRRSFVARSRHVLASRRLRGATCLVASIPPCTDPNVRTNRHDVILGSVECSIHEFDGMKLGKRRPDRAVLYVTEVAVSPSAQRCGVGKRLMEGVDKLASLRKVETLYLHVDVLNTGALELYRKAGYEQVTERDPMYGEFTMSLNLHDGATKGRRHYLLHKHLTTEPTWMNGPVLANDTAHGILGFEIPNLV